MSKNECEEARAALYDLLHGELCAEESTPIREHLATCPECREEERVCASLTEVVQRACAEESRPCPEELRGSILKKLSEA